ncbi:hypothetical protein FHR84_003160 [Actinopolyspora biskrensis]|uniref:C2H2-type domain-containing protein n=1 Tax=Actinopolyspora biskrensis TaxID=1470178 RepID=A0A852Z1F4_9ACTN|nr:hypothetical protein [Actinopolyspora biskrensis]NYH79822.1 hypothetical protein [Actinopolyspora biskrensis]
MKRGLLSSAISLIAAGVLISAGCSSSSPDQQSKSATSTAPIVKTWGEYPHGKLDTAQARSKNPVGPDGTLAPGKPHSGPSKQGTRMMRLHCPHCGYTVRATAKWLAHGNPRCPAGEELTL